MLAWGMGVRNRGIWTIPVGILLLFGFLAMIRRTFSFKGRVEYSGPYNTNLRPGGHPSWSLVRAEESCGIWLTLVNGFSTIFLIMYFRSGQLLNAMPLLLPWLGFLCMFRNWHETATLLDTELEKHDDSRLYDDMHTSIR
jgi:hypothetical protein